MHDFNDLVLFAKVVEHKGFSAASEQLGIPKSRLSRRIASLESRLGIRLLQRSSRRIAVTSVGQLFYERCQAMVALGEAAHEVIEQASSEPQGLLRASCPITLAQFWLAPLLPKFMREFPRVKLQLDVTNRRIDLLEEHMDVVVRVRKPPFADSSLVVRRLGQTVDVLVASPKMLAGRAAPTAPSELVQWPTLSLPGEGDRSIWRLSNGSRTAEVVHEPRLATGDMLALKQAAVDGLGIGLLPELLCRRELSDGSLALVAPDWNCVVSEIQAVFLTRRGMLPSVRAFIDFLSSHPPI